MICVEEMNGRPPSFMMIFTETRGGEQTRAPGRADQLRASVDQRSAAPGELHGQQRAAGNILAEPDPQGQSQHVERGDQINCVSFA